MKRERETRSSSRRLAGCEMITIMMNANGHEIMDRKEPTIVAWKSRLKSKKHGQPGQAVDTSNDLPGVPFFGIDQGVMIGRV